MNYPLLAAGVITTLAFLAHTLIGIRETLSTNPTRLASRAERPQLRTIERHWVQAVCGFQMVTVDLLALAVLLFVLATTDAIEAKRQVATGLSVLYLLWGLVWLGQLLVLRRRRQDFVALGQWAVWLVCAGLAYWGAQSD